jgi:hypothetical protein
MLRHTTGFIVLALVLLLGFSHALPLSSPSQPTKEKRSDQLVCTSSSWYDVVAFFLLNFVAHAATIRHYPGDNTFTQVFWTICALFLPFAGVWRACQSIANARPFEKDHLERAKYAGALCLFPLSGYWSLPTGVTELRGCQIKGKVPPTADGEGFVRCLLKTTDCDDLNGLREVSPHINNIHGYCFSDTKHGWGPLRIVPPDFKVASIGPEFCKVGISCSNSLAKCATAVVQVGFACFTLYRTRSNQIEEYGYAAFGLTVIPYALMSILNLIANLLTPEYPTLFMVHSDYMDMANQCTNETRFDGKVGTIIPKKAPSIDRRGYYDTIPVKLPADLWGVLYWQDHMQASAIQLPEGYVEDSTGELKVEISLFGRHETIPGAKATQRIRSLAAFTLGLLTLVIPYILIAVFTGFQTGIHLNSPATWFCHVVVGNWPGFWSCHGFRGT